MKKPVKKTIEKPGEMRESFERIETFIDNLAIMTKQGFDRFERRFQTVEVDIKELTMTTAKKLDILLLHDKFVSNERFDKLSLRITKLEEKPKR